MLLDMLTGLMDSAGRVESLILRVAILVCDLIGVMVIMTTVGKSVYHYLHRDLHVKLILARGIALALEFKLAGEVLRTVTIRDWNELVILGTIVLLRAAITVLIHWEIRADKKDEEEEKQILKELVAKAKAQARTHAKEQAY